MNYNYLYFGHINSTSLKNNNKVRYKSQVWLVKTKKKDLYRRRTICRCTLYTFILDSAQLNADHTHQPKTDRMVSVRLDSLTMHQDQIIPVMKIKTLIWLRHAQTSPSCLSSVTVWTSISAQTAGLRPPRLSSCSSCSFLSLVAIRPSRVAERLFANWHKEGSVLIWHLTVGNCTISKPISAEHQKASPSDSK